jgi:hypothetical protein
MRFCAQWTAPTGHRCAVTEAA